MPGTGIGVIASFPRFAMRNSLSSLRSWMRPRPQGRPAETFRPTVEGLEERTLLSTGVFVRKTNLVSDQPGKAAILDPDMINGWGIALPPTSGNFWVSGNGSGKALVYNGDVNGVPFKKNSLVVTIPGGKPTGQVFNNTSDFVVHSGTAMGPAVFIFASESGQITGWNPTVPLPPPSTQAQMGATVPDAVFKGLALGSTNGQNFLYAADFKGRRIRVFDKNFAEVSLAGNFRDKKIPRSFAPFNVQNIGGKLYVTYARRGPGGEDDVEGEGNGFVDVFDTNGMLLKRLVQHGLLNSPWGVAIAPDGWGKFSGKLLVGNFGDGTINAYNPNTGRFVGTLMNRAGRPFHIDELWGLQFGNGVTSGASNVLYFSAGPD